MAETTLVSPARRSDDKRWRQVDVRMRRLGYRPDGLIEVLHTTQEVFGYLDDDALAYVGESLRVPPSKVYGVATFYSYFTLKPQGEHTCVVCTGTACYINGAAALLDEVGRTLGVEAGGTTADGKVSVLKARCLGACSLAPAVVIDDEVHGKLTPAGLKTLLEAL
jgi:bidirectional [NiFe] hydrogenase diaphorase subunit